MVVLPCRMCWYPVPRERLERWPWAVTCSPDCSLRHEITARPRKDRASDRPLLHSWLFRYVRKKWNRTARHYTCHCGAGQIRITRDGEAVARWTHLVDGEGFHKLPFPKWS